MLRQNLQQAQTQCMCFNYYLTSVHGTYQVSSWMVFLIFTENISGKKTEKMATVKVSQGILKGGKSQTENGFVYYEFLGVPYAKPPIGELRFKVR